MSSASWASSPARSLLGVLVTLMFRSSFRRSLLYWSLKREEPRTEPKAHPGPARSVRPHPSGSTRSRKPLPGTARPRPLVSPGEKSPFLASEGQPYTSYLANESPTSQTRPSLRPRPWLVRPRPSDPIPLNQGRPPHPWPIGAAQSAPAHPLPLLRHEGCLHLQVAVAPVVLPALLLELDLGVPEV